MFCASSPLCIQCAKLMRQQVYKCSADTVEKNCLKLVVFRKFCTDCCISSHRSIMLPLMHIKCYSLLPLKVQSSSAVSIYGRQLSTARLAGSVFGRLLKLRYILLTGAVGGGITAHQVMISL